MASSGAGEVKPRTIYGGPYLEESAKIEAELLRHHKAGTKPSKDDLLKLFLEDGITEGAVKLIDTHIDGHPNAGYEGERAYETVEAHGNPIVEKPSEDYVFPGDGGLNAEDDYPAEPPGDTSAIPEGAQPIPAEAQEHVDEVKAVTEELGA